MSESSKHGPGGVVWDSAPLLVEYLTQDLAGEINGKTVLELGSGTGIVGIACSLLGAKEVILTDKGLVGLLKDNIALNSCQATCTPADLDWCCEDIPAEVRNRIFDVVIGCDITYNTHLYRPLKALLAKLCHERTLCVIAHKERTIEAGSAAEIVSMLEQTVFCGFHCERKLHTGQPGEGTIIYHLRKQHLGTCEQAIFRKTGELPNT